LRFEIIRGNVDTRLRKLRDGAYDAILLAVAGLERLGLSAAHVVPLDPDTFVPAVGQGALAVECRAADEALAAELGALLADTPATLAVEAERAFLRELRAGCQAPIGAHAVFNGAELTLRAALEAEGGGVVRAHSAARVESVDSAVALGVALAEEVAPLRGVAAPAANGSRV
jgi:hydroxymethylbilane synthase